MVYRPRGESDLLDFDLGEASHNRVGCKGDLTARRHKASLSYVKALPNSG